jgi:hypothetical protein
MTCGRLPMKFANILVTKISILLAVAIVSTGAEALEFDALIRPQGWLRRGCAQRSNQR